MRIPRELLRELITIEEYAGAGAQGPLYGAPTTLRANFQQTGSLATSNDGLAHAVVASVMIRPEDGPIAIQSRVTARGMKLRVVECYPMPSDFHPAYYSLQLEKFASGYSGSGL
jgi:hypothetical protein